MDHSFTMKAFRFQSSSVNLPQLRYLVLGAFISTFVPLLSMMVLSDPSTFNVSLLVQTCGYSLLAMLLSIVMLRSVSKYPGVESTAYIVPCLAIAYGAWLTILILARLPYSRLLLFSSFSIALMWFLMMYIVTGRRQMTIGVVPGGDHEMMLAIGRVNWVVFDDPKQDISGIHAITADLRSDLPSSWERRLADFALAGVPVYHTKHLAESLTGMVQLEHLSENSFGTLSPVSVFMNAKHVLDWLSAIITLILLLPVLLLIALVVRLDSPGPVIFRQTRVGYCGNLFTVYKFRTMITAAPGTSTLDAAKTQTEDKRITRIGAFLRRSRLDELPQMLNILKGEMSWIGPRPEAHVLSSWYEEQIPFYRYRHIVRPGLTGWAQVNQGHVAEVEDVRNKLYLDFYYIKNFSLWIDLLIIVRTIQTILTGFGAK